MAKLDIEAESEVLKNEFDGFMEEVFPKCAVRCPLLNNADITQIQKGDTKFIKELTWEPFEGLTMHYQRKSNMSQADAGFEITATREVKVGNGHAVKFVFFASMTAHLEDAPVSRYITANLDRNHILLRVNLVHPAMFPNGDMSVNVTEELEKDLPELFYTDTHHLRDYNVVRELLMGAVFRGAIGTSL